MQIFGYKAKATFGKLTGDDPAGFEIMISDDGTIKYNEINLRDNILNSTSYRFI